MDPIVLIHGYSAESRQTTPGAIQQIYGTLPQGLRDAYGNNGVVEIDLSRYITLEDGLTIDDISRAFDRVLRTEFASLLQRKFHVVIHSTGALVVRNWLRLFSSKPSPIANLVYLAGANFGSGWGHIGKGQLAKWGRLVFENGAERGLEILDALELGAERTIDLHLHFTRPGNFMVADYGVREAVITGTQADVKWFTAPIRYAKEDGSDGVVRVSGANLNFHYIRVGPTREAYDISWNEINRQMDRHLAREGVRKEYYERKEANHGGTPERPTVPLGIPFRCAHTGETMGIVTGSGPRPQVMRMLRSALEATPETWPALVEQFEAETAKTYERAIKEEAPAWWKKWMNDPRAQYDHHAQVIFRIRDQHGFPVPHYDIFFESTQRSVRGRPIQTLFEDKHVNDKSPHVIMFYLRTNAFVNKSEGWKDWLAEVDICSLEITAAEPQTGYIVYLPFRFELNRADMRRWLEGHHTTIFDVELLRLPSPDVFRMVRLR
jgi:pimeloyl-ACP methyl ester carboxylesterase